MGLECSGAEVAQSLPLDTGHCSLVMSKVTYGSNGVGTYSLGLSGIQGRFTGELTCEVYMPNDGTCF